MHGVLGQPRGSALPDKSHKLSVCRDASGNRFLARRGLMGVATPKKQPNRNRVLGTPGRRIGVISFIDMIPSAASGHNWLGQEKKLEARM